MKMMKLMAAAGLMVATLAGAGVADAQRHDDRRGGYDQRDNGGGYGRGDDQGHHYGRDRHQRCHTEYRHHRRVRICR